MSGIKGCHAQRVEVDEINDFPADPADLLGEAADGLTARFEQDPGAALDAFRKAVARQEALRDRAVTCPFCQGGMAFSAHSILWGHNCWICGGWGMISAGMRTMRGPFAPRPRRQSV